MNEFLTGVLLLTVMSTILTLLLPDDLKDDFLPLLKIAMGIWIIHAITNLFGHSLF